MNASLYKITFPNDKVYIGITTKKPETRLSEHFLLSKHENKRKVYKAMRHFGTENLTMDVLKQYEDVEWSFMCELETQTIKEYDSFNNGYNGTLGGEGTVGLCGSLNAFYGKKHTPENLKIMSEKGYLRKHTEETKNKISKRNKGRLHKEESIQKMREKASSKIVICENDKMEFKSITSCAEFYNLQRSDVRKVCNRERATAKGYVFSWKGDNSPFYKDSREKPIKCVETGVVFASTKEACESLGIRSQHVSAILRGKQKTTKGYSFVYA